MFGGSYTHSLDTAGRFVMPMSIRTQLGLRFYITKGVGCLCVFTEDWKNELEGQLEGMGNPLQQLLNPDLARLNRHFFSGMVESSADKQNRVQLTPEHRRYAGIGEDVVICGCGQYVELWSPDELDKYRAENDGVDHLIAAGVALLPSLSEQAAGDADAGVSHSGSA